LLRVYEACYSMKGYDAEGAGTGPRKPLPDSVMILEPPVDKIITEPSSEQREPLVPTTAIPVGQAPEQDYQPQEPAPYQADPYSEGAPAASF
jgi:small subunit ribosomal protein S3e